MLYLLIVLASCSNNQEISKEIAPASKTRLLLDSLLDKSLSQIGAADFNQAKETLSQTQELSITAYDTLSLSSTLNNLGLIEYRLGNYQKGISFYVTALNLDKSLGDSARIGRRLKNIGICFRKLGSYEIAIRYYLEALNIAEVLGNEAEIASVNNSLGILYNSLENHSRAYESFSISRNLWKKNDPKKYVIVLSNIGNALLGLNKPTEAAEVYQEALRLKRNTNNESSISITLNNLGEAYSDQGQFTLARKCFSEALIIKERVADKNGVAIVSNNLATLELILENYESAESWLKKSKSLSEEVESRDIQMEYFRLSTVLNKKTGNFEKALEFEGQYYQMKESLFNDQIVQVKDLQFQFDLNEKETAKATAESLLVESEEREIEQSRKNQIQILIIVGVLLIAALIGHFALKLRKQNGHIENLIRELHHRVKNHLGMISGMFGAQSQETAITNTDLLEEARTRVEAVNGIHRRLYRQDEYEFVNMQEYLTELVDNSALVFGVFHNIEKHLDIQSEPMEIDKAISVGLIANEVLTNAFKYGLQKTEKPVLKIVLEKAVKGYRMLIYNNAPPNSEPISESTGFGKELIKRLTDNLKGESNTTEQNGFHFELTFP